MHWPDIANLLNALGAAAVLVAGAIDIARKVRSRRERKRDEDEDEGQSGS